MPRRILLVNPNRMRPPVTPVGLDYIGQYLREQGFEVELLDLAFSEDVASDVRSALAEEPLLVGVTVRNLDDCQFASRDFCLAETTAILNLIRNHTNAPVLLGGIGFSVMPVEVLRYTRRDMGVRGDGEAALAEVGRRLDLAKDFRDVPGLVWRRWDEYIESPMEDPDLAAFGSATRDLVDNARYLREGAQVGFETKRGCHHLCTYCADPIAKGRRVRLRSPQAVADELESLLRQGVDVFHTCDAEFNVPPGHAKEVCRKIAERGLGKRIQWYAYAEPSGFDGELARLMRRAGCVGINFGADHSEEAMLKALGRRHDKEDLRRVADLCRKHDIMLMVDLLLGGPGETPESVAAVLDYMREIEALRVGVGFGVRLYPGTKLVEQIRQNGGLKPENQSLHGVVEDNEGLLQPIFYVSESLGPDPETVLRDMIAGDERFFFADRSDHVENYNYNDNSVLCDAIRRGCRGAYWDILRQLAEE